MQQSKTTKRWTLEYPELGVDPLPTAPYLTAEQFELERDKVFRRCWLNVGRVDEIPNPGDYLTRTIEICKAPVLVVRGRDGAVRGFYNVCRHRGTKVVCEERGSASAFSCRYHGWTYSAEGRLIGVPEEDMFFNLKKGELGLVPLATDVWGGFIFVSLDPAPEESLPEYLGELIDLLDGYPFDRLPVCFAYRAHLRCNWKLLVDSQQEGYHAKTLHRRSLPGFLTNRENPSLHAVNLRLYRRHHVISYYGNRDRKLSPMEALAYRFGTSVAKFAEEFSADRLPPGVNPTRDPNHAFDEYVVFPNFHLLLFPGMYITHLMWPTAVDGAVWEARMYLPRAETASERFSQEYSRCLLRDTWLEDGSTLEISQAGLESGATDAFVLQDQELLIRGFHKVLREYTG